MGSLMDGLDAEAYDRQYTGLALLVRIARYFRVRRGTMTLAVLLIALNSLINAVFPLLISHSLDVLITTGVFQTTTLLIAVILVVSLLAWLFAFLQQRLTSLAVADVVFTLRKETFAAMMAHDLSFYDEFSSGKIVSRVTSDSEEFAMLVTLTLNLLSQFLLFFLLVAFLFFRDASLAWLAMLIVPAVVLVALVFRRIARRVTRHTQRSLARVNANIQEVVSGIAVAKNFRQELSMYREFEAINRQSYRINLRSGFLSNGVFPLLVLIANLGTTIIVFFGGTSVLAHSVSAGDWFLFVQSIGLLWFPLTSMAAFWSQFQLGLSASERVFALLDAEPRVRQCGQQPVEHLRGKIEFRNLCFSYSDRQRVLTSFNLAIAPGETVALVGHTGAGKSSLARLIARFYEYQGGELLIDGRDIRSFDLRTYRRQLGIVPQVPFLFSGTIAENIGYACPAADARSIELAALSIGHGDWLEALPEGLQTRVGEAGRALSLGQRQLVALARVLLQNPSIIILDEATASVDPLTEAQIQEGLALLLEKRTALLIAHRLSTIQQADRILVLSHGQIVEEGTHAALLQQRGSYAQLYNTYFRHQSPDYHSE